MQNNIITVESLCASEKFQKYCLAPGPKDTLYWDQWLMENSEHNATFEQAKQMLQQLSFHISEDEISDELDKLNAKLPSIKKAVPQKTRRRIFFKIVAAASILLLATFGIWQAIPPKPVLTKIVTNYGETKEISLPDNSTVILNANSILEFDANGFKTSDRKVWLSGEAYFEVVHKDDQPFSVNTEKGKINVLGTSFNVLKRAENLRVTLLTGKVQLTLSNNTILNLNPGEQVEVNDNIVNHKKVDVALTIAWKEGKLIFKNASIQSIIDRLQNEYNWTIKVKDEQLLKRKVNATILKNNPELLLEALKEIYELKIERLSEGVYKIE